MARERIDLPIQNYGLFKQRSMLKNCTQLPTLSGNAEVQIATVPTVRDMFGRPSNATWWIPSGKIIKQVEQCFDWTIYRVAIGNSQTIILRNSIGETARVYTPFDNYEATEANHYGHFTSTEFVDKDALRWVIIQFNDKAYKFRDEFHWNNNINETPTEDNIDANDIIEVFIQGTYYLLYNYIKEFNYSGTFFYNDESYSWEGVDGLLNKLKDLMNSFEFGESQLVHSNEFRELHRAKSLYDVTTDSDYGNTTPRSWSYYDGIGAANMLATTIDDDNDRGMLKADVSNITSAENLKKVKIEFETWSAAGIATGAGTGATVGGIIGTVVPAIGNIIGAAVGAFLGGFFAWVLGLFGDMVLPRWWVEPFSENDHMEEGKLNDNTNKIVSAAAAMLGSPSFVGLRDKKTIGNNTYWNLPWVQDSSHNGELVFTEDGDDLPTFLVFLSLVTNLRDKCRELGNKAVQIILFNGDGMNDWYHRTVSGSGFLSAIADGGTVDVISNVNHYGLLGGDITLRKTEVTFEKSLTSYLASIDSLFKYAGRDPTSRMKEFVSILDSTIWKTIIKSPAGGIDSALENLKEYKQSIVDSETFSDADVKLIDNLIKHLSQLRTRLVNILKTFYEYNSETETLGKVKSWLGDDVTYMDITKAASAIRTFNSRATLAISKWNTVKEDIEELKPILLAHKNDYPITWIEQLSHMLIAVSEMENRFYYSNPGSTDIEPLNFYTAEYANAKIYECWRLANRLVFITDKTVEFWDITNDFEDPLSPAYASNVYSIVALRNSMARFNDTLYFIGKQVEMDTYSVFALNKNGVLTSISYPQLETWINRQLFTQAPNSILPANYSDVIGSVINIENAPFISWHLKDGVESIFYNLQFNNFFWNDDLFFLVDNKYWKYDGFEIGRLDKYFDSRAGYSIPCRIVTTNTNFEGHNRSVIALAVDLDLEEGKRDPRESIVYNLPASTDGTGINGQEALPILQDEKRDNIVSFKFNRVSKMPWTSLRRVRLQPKQGSRNVCFKVFGLGLGTDFQTEINWNGYLRFNKLWLEVE